MDAEYQYFSFESPLSGDNLQQDSSSFHHLSQSGVQCLLCRRAFSLEAEVNDGFEAIHICRECKIMVLDDNQTNLTIRDIHQIRRQRRRNRFGSSDPMEDSFSHRISQLINLVNQNNDAQFGVDNPITARRHVRYYAARSMYHRWRNASSDNDSDVLYQLDSMFGETDSNSSLAGHGGDSDASPDRHSLLDSETFFQLENGSYVSTDTDIDPMHAGLDQWNSDGQDDEDGEWQEADWVEANNFVDTHQHLQDDNSNRSGNGTGGTRDGAWFQWRAGETQVQYADIVADLEGLEFRPAHVGNPGDYVDARGFEDLLEQLAEIDGSRRGAPPAAASSVRLLPSVVISKDYGKNDIQICAICKDPFLINTEAKQLPCRHLYHPSCIFPWLKIRNSCPVCRYDLPTSDPEYEVKRILNRTGRHESWPLERDVETYDMFTEQEITEAHDISNARAEHGSLQGVDQVANRSSREGSRGRWLFLAAAPLVSIVGIILVFWLRKPAGDGRIQANIREQHLHRSQSTTSAADRNRRWWSIF